MGPRCWLILLTLFMTGAVVSVRAGQNRVDADVRQTIQARKVLADDADLAHLNIGVIVTDRIAVLWGTVPTAADSFRAELRLRTMIELAEVRNELFVSEPLEPIVKPIKINKPPQWVPSDLPQFFPKERRGAFTAPSVPMIKPAEIKVAPSEVAPTPALGTPQVDLEFKRLRD